MTKVLLPGKKMRRRWRVAIYRRVSTSKQVDGFGLDAQDELCRRWLDLMLGVGNYLIVDVYTDGGISGKLREREDLDRMNADIAAGRIDLVIFGKLDRIGRTMKNIHRWVYDTQDIEVEKGRNVRIVTADNRIDSEGDMFEVTLALLAYMAEMEHALILERTMSGRIQKVMAGGWPHGGIPYGYMIDPETGDIVVNPLEAIVIEAAVEYLVDYPEYLTRGEIAKKLNAKGYRTRKGHLWDGSNLAQRVKKALRRTVEFTFAAGTEDEQTHVLPLPEIVSSARAVLALEALERSAKTKSPANDYPLSGRLISLCGVPMTGAVDNRKDVRYYRCQKVREGAEYEHDCQTLYADEVEAAVMAEVTNLVADPDRLHELIKESLGSTPQRLESYRRRLEQIDETLAKQRRTRKKAIARLMVMVEAGEDDGDEDDADFVEEMRQEVEELKARYKEDERELLQERERVESWIADIEGEEERALQVVAAADKLRTKVGKLSKREQADLIEMLDIQVQVEGTAKVHRKGNFDPLSKWHWDTGEQVPAELTDEMWEKVSSIISNTQKWKDVRGAFEVTLEKIRTGRTWMEYDKCEQIGGRAYNTLMRTVRRWDERGEYRQALKALDGYRSVPAAPQFSLPPMRVTGAISRVPKGITAGQTDGIANGELGDVDGRGSPTPRSWTSSRPSSRRRRARTDRRGRPPHPGPRRGTRTTHRVPLRRPAREITVTAVRRAITASRPPARDRGFLSPGAGSPPAPRRPVPRHRFRRPAARPPGRRSTAAAANRADQRITSYRRPPPHNRSHRSHRSSLRTTRSHRSPCASPVPAIDRTITGPTAHRPPPATHRPEDRSQPLTCPHHQPHPHRPGAPFPATRPRSVT
ncbi:recombinase family protein [Streptomyces sp. LP11]|uniref:Recombinase family protein n=1 Tax=Streptomyces pyxinicus TaxID=2970331 RepID=A0ABT2AY00_9ACTN|nr:recombinase family protein [Streptomyces sp. LP11]MCS0601136.1 recombinase family protein [Streptomyces sp. LP11]